MQRSILTAATVMTTVGCLLGAGGCMIRERTPATAATFSSRTAAFAPGTGIERITSGGLTRRYRLHVPPGPAPHPALVIALHGSLGTGDGMARLTGYDAVADANGVIVAYPDGVGRSWADGRNASPADRQGVDDVAFLSALVADLVRRGVDPDRVYVTGMSNGAFMAQRFGCERADLVAAIAPVAGTYGVGLACAPSRPVSVLEIHGTADPIVPYAGGPMRDRNGTRATIESVARSVQRWRRLDGCAAADAEAAAGATGATGAAAAGPTVQVTWSSGCRGGTAVQLWSVADAGHTWPGGLQYLPKAIIGPTSDAFSASRLSWAFFAAHPRPKTP